MKLRILVASCVAMAAAAPALAAPVQWTVASGGNGHYYDFVSGSFAWGDARTVANSSSHLGQQGYLATVTSAGEQAFLNGVASSLAWIGGTYANSAWRWADGPEAGQSFFGTANPDINFSFWAGGEPNGNAAEPAIVFNWNPSTGAWNDWGPGNTVGYFVEFSGAAVPEPASWAMMIGGFGLLGAAARRRRTLTFA